jgi:iron complex outermembrane recepter protein
MVISPAACVAIALALAASVVLPATAADPDGSLIDEPLESLLSMEITSASKRPQRLSETPAAIFVITREDIRRSGLANVPELLRLVPGVSVGRATPKAWAIGVRGDESQFSRMLLVLLDGRTLYTPSFNGTFWELTDVPLEDIERIEVIRGPGASVWGANAVHGVINIIRRKPEEQQSFLTTQIGREERVVSSLGHTGSTGPLHYRLSGHYVNRDAFRARDDSASQHDDYRYATTSLRSDVDLGGGDGLTVQGDWYGGDLSGQYRRDLDMTGASPLRSFETASISGGNTLLRYERRHSEHASTELQLYADHVYREIVIGKERRTQYDLELRNRFKHDRHLVNWGLGARHVRERIGNTLNLTATPSNAVDAVYNAYVQDEIELADGAARLILGTKFEWNTFTGWEIQPTARALWHLTERHQVWVALSRAVRVPTRVDRGDFDVRPAYIANTPVQVRGTRSFDSEVIVEADLGYRFQPTSHVYLDLTAYTQQTENFGVFVLQGLSQELRDSSERYNVGGEASLHWQPSERWKLRLGWSHVHIRHTGDTFSPAGSDSAPPHQLSLISYLDLPGNLELDFAVYYHGHVADRTSTLTHDELNAYTRHDLRIAWLPSEHLELSLVGQNLLDRLHREQIDFLEGAPILTGLPQSAVERSFFARVTWRY